MALFFDNPVQRERRGSARLREPLSHVLNERLTNNSKPCLFLSTWNSGSTRITLDLPLANNRLSDTCLRTPRSAAPLKLDAQRQHPHLITGLHTHRIAKAQDNFPSPRDGKLVRAPGVEPGSMASEATTLSIVLRSLLERPNGRSNRYQVTSNKSALARKFQVTGTKCQDSRPLPNPAS